MSYGSLDGSALIALGILMEEACKEALGETGDLALVEGEEVDEQERSTRTSHKGHQTDERDREGSSARKESDKAAEDSHDDTRRGISRRKRRKVRHDSPDEEG